MLITFVAFGSLDAVAVESSTVLALEPIGALGTRISVARGASELTGPSVVDVAGDVATTAAALGADARLALFTLLGTSDPCAVSAAHVAAIEAIGSTGARISIPRGASELTGPPFVEVNGSVADAVLAFGSVPAVPSSFAAQYLLQVAAGGLSTNSPAFVFVTGAQIQIPTGGAGVWLLFCTSQVGSSSIANGARITASRNFTPIGAEGVWGPGDLSPTESVSWASMLTVLVNDGDTLEIIGRADPGGGADVAIFTEPRITAWRT